MDLGWHLFLRQLVHYHAHITRCIRPHHSQDMQDFHCDYRMCESAICQWVIFDILLTDKLTDDGQNQLLNPCAQYTLMQIAAPIFQSPQHSWWGLVLAEMRLVQWVTWSNIYFFLGRCGSLIVHACNYWAKTFPVQTLSATDWFVLWSVCALI